MGMLSGTFSSLHSSNPRLGRTKDFALRAALSFPTAGMLKQVQHDAFCLGFCLSPWKAALSVLYNKVSRPSRPSSLRRSLRKNFSEGRSVNCCRTASSRDDGKKFVRKVEKIRPGCFSYRKKQYLCTRKRRKRGQAAGETAGSLKA